MLSGIGFGELAVICIVLIIAVGPERLPQMMRTIGKTLRTVRQASRDIRSATGIDELMREDFLEPRRPPVRRPVAVQGPAPVSRADTPAAEAPAAEAPPAATPPAAASAPGEPALVPGPKSQVNDPVDQG